MDGFELINTVSENNINLMTERTLIKTISCKCCIMKILNLSIIKNLKNWQYLPDIRLYIKCKMKFFL